MTTQDQLSTPPHLNGRHQHTYDAIFRHPTAHNLEWHDIRSLLEAMCDVADSQNGSIGLTRNGSRIVLHAHEQESVASVEQVMDIRRFLEQSDGPPATPSVASSGRLLVVIDHHQAKIYRDQSPGSIPEHLVPEDPHGFGRHLQSENPETDGKRQPERRSFYEAVAARLRGANEILIFGNGTGESSAMEQLLANLKHHHADVAGRVVGSSLIDGHHQTEGQLLAKARAFFASTTVG